MTAPPVKTSWQDTCTALRGRDLLSIRDLTRDELIGVLGLAAEVRREPARYAHALAGKTLATIFEKPSLRTRVSFEAGMTQLGGHAIYLGPSDISMGKRESVADIARTLSGMADAIMARTFSHAAIAELARRAAVPVINGLSDHQHPCQALADFLTIREEFGRTDVTLAYVGDGNNVTHSLMHAGAMLGATIRVATPREYAPDPAVVRESRKAAAETGGRIEAGHDAAAAVEGADVVYTDTWASMGQEAEHAARLPVFRPYQVDGRLMQRASPRAIFLHCLPAHRGEEVTGEVLESAASRIFPQAHNRLHAQKALLVLLAGDGAPRKALGA